MRNEHKPGHRIAVISDTHNLLRPEVADIIKSCELVLHGGDISGPDTLEKIRSLSGNYYVVRGNNDRDWASDIPYTLEVELYGRKFFITHKKKDIPSDVDADVVIYGHSHRYAQDYIDGTLYLNPGSCGPRRFNQAITMAVLTVPEKDLAEDILADGGTEKKSYGITVERIDIPHAKAASTSGVVCSEAKETSGVVCTPQSGHGRPDPQDRNGPGEAQKRSGHRGAQKCQQRTYRADRSALCHPSGRHCGADHEQDGTVN